MKGYYSFGPFRLYFDNSTENKTSEMDIDFEAPRLEKDGVLVPVRARVRDFLFKLIEIGNKGISFAPIAIEKNDDFYRSLQLYTTVPAASYSLGCEAMEVLGQTSFDGPYLKGHLGSEGHYCWFFVAKAKKTTCQSIQAKLARSIKASGGQSNRKSFKYDVCISFAGEDRKVAESLASLLIDYKVSVFFDEYEKANLWGKDLYQHLASVYKDKCRYCVILISKYYKKKLFPKHELRQVQARAFEENREYILPVKIDDTTLPGISKTVGYLDLRVETIDGIAKLLVKKLKNEL
jgi:hypothetical protein